MLLEARKVRWLEQVYAAYGRRLLRRSFARIWLGGADFPRGTGPLIAYLNHAAWWDPILGVFLSRYVARTDGFGPMDATQLRRFPFFRRVGCFAATTDSIEDARLLASYAAHLLRGGPRRALWIFPQGALLPSRVPLRFRSGTARFSRAVPEAPLVPIAVRYEMRDERRPEIFVRVGAALRAVRQPMSAAAHTRLLEQALAAELAQLDRDLAEGGALGGYRVL
jgi:1-acyl-sn-glycerol-3-phosphate acyltransferase